MRPIDKGDWPTENGKKVEFSEYKEALGELIGRLGQYCSYCESKIPSGLAIEHRIPKSVDQSKERDWDNFLLSCINCNSSKGSTPVIRENHAWPDQINTYLSLQYHQSGKVIPNPERPEDEQKKAQNLIDLLALNRSRKKENQDENKRIRRYKEVSDRRLSNRVAAWRNAQEALELYLKILEDGGDQEAASQLVLLTVDGFWSVYMTVFQDIPEIRKLLVNSENFPGMNPNCFDIAGNAIEWSL